MKNLITISLMLCTAVCLGEVKKTAIELTGEWSGKKELGNMTLNHKDGKITGQICEMKGHDCMDIKGAKLKDNTLTFHYVFKKRKNKIQVDVELLLSDDRKTLTGNATIKAAGINLDLIFERSDNHSNRPDPSAD